MCSARRLGLGLLLLTGLAWGVPPPEFFPETFPNPPAPPDPPLRRTQQDRITAGQTLAVGGQLWSPQRRYRLEVQDDGNAVLYQHSPEPPRPLWSTSTRGQGCRLSLEPDGGIRLRDGAGKLIWLGGTPDRPGDYYLQLQEDGNLVLYRRDGPRLTAVWATNTQHQ